MSTYTLRDAIKDTLRDRGVGVLPTDTLYGIVGSARRPATVRRIYKLRKRNPKKPMIILVASIADLRSFGVRLDKTTRKKLARVWPGPVSVVLPLDPRRPSLVKKFNYLHRGTKTLAFRVPNVPWLQSLLKTTGPLVAPSANHEGMPPAKTIYAAKKYFGDHVDFYIDAGRRAGKASTLITIEDGRVIVLRAGAKKI